MARSRKQYTRADQLAGDKEIRKALLKVFDAVEQGFMDQIERSDDQFDHWDIYNCKLGGKQFYSGNTKLYIPAVHNAVKARKTRFTNQMFPQAGRYIECTTEDGEIPYANMALLEGYVRRAKLRTRVVPASLVAGDVEGQYTLLATWGQRERNTVSRETSPIKVGGMEHPDLGDVEILTEDVLIDAGPEAEVVHDGDLMILPATVDSVQEALEVGGSVTVIRRWSRETLEALKEAGDLDVDEVDTILEAMKPENLKDTEKSLADAAGIKIAGGKLKHAVIYRTWCKIEVGGTRRLVLAYYGGEQRILGAKLCPYWCDMPDVFTAPVEKMAGVAKGVSQVKPCGDVQYLINDITNAGMDSAFYALLPVLLVDPQKSPNYRSLVMDLMAVWEVDPASTKVMEFPALYEKSFAIVQEGERMIAQTLSISPAMMPQSTGSPGRKRSQAEVALEQQVEILATADAVIAYEEDILTPMIQFWAELDYQYRDKEVTVRSMGELGVKAEMVRVPPGSNRRWSYRWFGVEAARTAQQVQQQISFANVLAQVAQHPSVAQAGYKVNLVPIIKTISENIFGPRLTPEIFYSARDEVSLDPEFENEMMAQGQLPMVAMADQDPKHMQSHMQWSQQNPMAFDSPQMAVYHHHMMAHQQQMQAKQQAQTMQQMAQMMQQGGGRNQPRGPRPGATPQPPRMGPQAPPGAIHPDAMKGGLVQMPRKM